MHNLVSSASSCNTAMKVIKNLFKSTELLAFVHVSVLISELGLQLESEAQLAIQHHGYVLHSGEGMALQSAKEQHEHA